MPYTPFPTREGTQAGLASAQWKRGGWEKGGRRHGSYSRRRLKAPSLEKEEQLQEVRGGLGGAEGWGSGGTSFPTPSRSLAQSLGGKMGRHPRAGWCSVQNPPCALGDVSSPATSELTCGGQGGSQNHMGPSGGARSLQGLPAGLGSSRNEALALSSHHGFLARPKGRSSGCQQAHYRLGISNGPPSLTQGFFLTKIPEWSIVPSVLKSPAPGRAS